MGSGTDGIFGLENFYCYFGMELAGVENSLDLLILQLPAHECWHYRLRAPALVYGMSGIEPSCFLVLNQYFPN